MEQNSPIRAAVWSNWCDWEGKKHMLIYSWDTLVLYSQTRSATVYSFFEKTLLEASMSLAHIDPKGGIIVHYLQPATNQRMRQNAMDCDKFIFYQLLCSMIKVLQLIVFPSKCSTRLFLYYTCLNTIVTMQTSRRYHLFCTASRICRH